MNVKILKGFGIFVLGAVGGGVATSIILKNKYELIIKEEIDSIRATYKRAIASDNYEKIVDDQEAAASDRGKRSTVINRDKYKRIAEKYGPGPIVENIDQDDEEEQEQYRKGERESSQTHYNGAYIIDTEQFSEEMPNFDKLTISFYVEDDVLVDENDEIIDDVVGIVGEQALTSFGMGSDDPDVVYVRNENLSIDYEVICIHASYSETVLGIKRGERNGKRNNR